MVLAAVKQRDPACSPMGWPPGPNSPGRVQTHRDTARRPARTPRKTKVTLAPCSQDRVLVLRPSTLALGGRAVKAQ